MAIIYTLDTGRDDLLTVYEGEVPSSNTVKYRIKPARTTVYGEGSYHVMAPDGYTVIYTVVHDRLRPQDYMVYRGTSIIKGSPVDYYVQMNHEPYPVIREGDSISGSILYNIIEDKTYKYSICSVEAYGQAGYVGRGSGYLEWIIGGLIIGVLIGVMESLHAIWLVLIMVGAVLFGLWLRKNVDPTDLFRRNRKK